jgi:c-di-GMP-binding flagellar brake protein YcgR
MELTEKSLASVASEKREHRRFDVDLPIRYGRTNLLFKFARAVNASQGGLLLRLPEEVNIGQRLALKLFFPSPLNSEFNTVETSVQVVWMDIHLRKDRTWDYQTGVKFIDLSQENKNKLKNFLWNVAGKPAGTA